MKAFIKILKQKNLAQNTVSSCLKFNRSLTHACLTAQLDWTYITMLHQDQGLMRLVIWSISDWTNPLMEKSNLSSLDKSWSDRQKQLWPRKCFALTDDSEDYANLQRCLVKGKDKMSEIWNHLLEKKLDKKVVKCRHCHRIFKNHGSTSTFTHNLERKHGIKSKQVCRAVASV